MRKPFRLGSQLLGLLGWVSRNRRQRRRAAAQRRNTYRQLQFDALEPRVILNADPVAVDDEFYVYQGSTVEISHTAMLSNDTDEDEDPLSVYSFDSTTAQGVSVSFSGGVFVYGPPSSFSGDDYLNYTVDDGQGGFDTGTVTIHVMIPNHAPTSDDLEFEVDEDDGLEIDANSGLLQSAEDEDNDTLSAVTYNGSTNAGGHIVIYADGSFVYTPTSDFNGEDYVDFYITDGEDPSAAVRATFTVNPINDAPTASDSSPTISEDGSTEVGGSDVDGDDLTATVVSGPSHGTAQVNSNGTITYTPDANYYGTDSFQFKVNDGIADSSVATVSLTINAVNDAPVRGDDSATTDEDTPINASAGTLLYGATDVEGDSISVVAGAGSTSGGGYIVIYADGSYTYTPASQASGVDEFKYRLTDGTTQSVEYTMTVTVHSVQDDPTAADDEYEVDENGTLTANGSGYNPNGVAANDGDADGDTLTFTLISGPAGDPNFTFNSNGTFVYSPGEFYGNTSFVYEVDDGHGHTVQATAHLTVNPINDAPIITMPSDRMPMTNKISPS